MLVEVRCDKFREKSIKFHKGLNVVLGDEKATNSIGKSSLLMVLDFIFGGSSLIEHNNDIVEELGDHYYLFEFVFNDVNYYFKRGTSTPDLIYACDTDYTEKQPISIDDYRTFLKTSYDLGDIDLSFRSVVSLYSRVWGKDNYDVKQPLHGHKNQKSIDCMDNLLKLYKQYGSIKALARKLNELTEERKAIKSAFKQSLIPKISKTQYKENIHKVSEIDDEIRDIKDNLAKYAVHISEIVNREVSEIKAKKDSLLRERSRISVRLNRVRADLAQNKHIKSKSFSSLVRFFPDVDQDKISQVEEFHSKITKILKAELKESERELSDGLDAIDEAIRELDDTLQTTFSSIDKPDIIVDRVHELANVRSAAQAEIRYFEQEDRVDDEVKGVRDDLIREKARVLKFVEDIINNKTRQYVSSVYSEERRSPTLQLSQRSYTFTAIEDTGTGKAYSNLILFDLAVFETTSLPFVIHDSVLFKNVENAAVAKMVELYISLGKQSFIAIDEIKKYGDHAAKLLTKEGVISLSDDNVLYIKDWRK